MAKEVLQITITTRKASKNKIIRWFQHLWFNIWHIYKPKILSKVCWFLSELILKILPKEEREKLRKEYNEIDMVIIDKTKENNGRT
jgi:hypothetical protein